MPDPKKGPNGNYTISVSVAGAYSNVSWVLYKNGTVVAYTGTAAVPSPSATVTFNVPVNAADCGSYYDVQATTYKLDGTMVTYASHRSWYVYGWQKRDGLGTAYGADMEITDIDNNGVPDLVGMISNRTSGSVNGISYRIFMNVDANGANGTQTAIVTKLLLPNSSSIAPSGGAMAIDDLNNNGRKDIIFVTYTSLGAGQPYYFRYIVGWDITNAGAPTSWSSVYTADGIGSNVPVDIGADIVDVNNDGTKDLVLSGIWATVFDSYVYYKVGPLGTAGNATFTTPLKSFPITLSTTNLLKGGGMDIADLKGNGTLTMVSTHYSTSGTPFFYNNFIDLNSTADPASSGYISNTRETVGADCLGAGVSIGKMDGNTTPDLLQMSYVGGQFRFHIDYDVNYHYNLSDNSDIWLRFGHGACTAFTY
jgi:hypothetical protein